MPNNEGGNILKACVSSLELFCFGKSRQYNSGEPVPRRSLQPQRVLHGAKCECCVLRAKAAVTPCDYGLG